MEDQKVEICWPTPRGHGTEPSLQIQSRQGDIRSTICNHVWLTTISRCCDLLWNGQSLLYKHEQPSYGKPDATFPL